MRYRLVEGANSWLELAKVKVSDLQVVLAVGTSRCQW